MSFIRFPRIVGADHAATLTNGTVTRAVLLNNAATTPPFEDTLLEVNRFLLTYSALNRGAGPMRPITYRRSRTLSRPL